MFLVNFEFSIWLYGYFLHDIGGMKQPSTAPKTFPTMCGTRSSQKANIQNSKGKEKIMEFPLSANASSQKPNNIGSKGKEKIDDGLGRTILFTDPHVSTCYNTSDSSFGKF